MLFIYFLRSHFLLCFLGRKSTASTTLTLSENDFTQQSFFISQNSRQVFFLRNEIIVVLFSSFAESFLIIINGLMSLSFFHSLFSLLIKNKIAAQPFPSQFFQFFTFCLVSFSSFLQFFHFCTYFWRKFKDKVKC